MARKSRGYVRRLMQGAADYAAWRAADSLMRAREAARDIGHGGRFRCDHCNRNEPSLSRWKAHATRHHLEEKFARSAKARKVARQMGRPENQRRIAARSGLQGYGLRDDRGKHTARSLSRPEVPATPSRKHLKDAHRHHRDHEKAEARDRKAQSLHGKGKHDRAARHEQTARDLRARWPKLREAPAPRVKAPRPAPERPARANGDGRVPRERDNSRTPPAPRLPSRPEGRLAPQRAANGTREHSNGRDPHANGRTPEPARTTGRTR